MSDDWDAVWDDGPPKFNPPQHAAHQGKGSLYQMIIQENRILVIFCNLVDFKLETI